MGPNSSESGEITLLLNQWQEGNREAESALFSAMYHALYRIAVNCVRNEDASRSLGPTALVHEAYLRFNKAQTITLNNRSHFLALSAQVMRRILVDRARARRSNKRDGMLVAEELADLVQTDRDADQIIAVDRAMDVLSGDCPEEAQIVELRWFAGYSEKECAAILSISAKTVQRRWKVARTRLKVLIDGYGTEASG